MQRQNVYTVGEDVEQLEHSYIVDWNISSSRPFGILFSEMDKQLFYNKLDSYILFLIPLLNIPNTYIHQLKGIS